MRKIGTLVFLLFFTTISQASNLWQLSPEKSIPVVGEQKLSPNSYLLAKLDVVEFSLIPRSDSYGRSW